MVAVFEGLYVGIMITCWRMHRLASVLKSYEGRQALKCNWPIVGASSTR